jgi:hypothetical protein
MRSDAEIKTDVETELRFVPSCDASDIAAAVTCHQSWRQIRRMLPYRLLRS